MRRKDDSDPVEVVADILQVLEGATYAAFIVGAIVAVYATVGLAQEDVKVEANREPTQMVDVTFAQAIPEFDSSVVFVSVCVLVAFAFSRRAARA